MYVRESERDSVCACVRERERESVCVCERERERERRKTLGMYSNLQSLRLLRKIWF